MKKKHEEHKCCCCHEEHDHAHYHEHSCGCGHDHSHSEGIDKKKIIFRYSLGAIPIIVGFMRFIPFYIPFICAVLGYLAFGADVFRGMISGFARKKVFTEFTLMCVATLGAFTIGEYADAAAVMYLYSLGEAVSDSAYVMSRRSISELFEISAEYANLLHGGEIKRVSPEDIALGDEILVRAGERVPVDSIVIRGGGSADTSSVTGESKPLALYEGIFCPSGSMITDGSVTLRAEREYHNSVVAKLHEAVESAQMRRSTAEKKISVFAAVFTPIAFSAAMFTFIIGFLITGDLAQWMRLAITVLVVSCPCSLVLSVPLTYFAGMGCAARRGIVFRGGEVMDRTQRLCAVCFDKTGTLTDSELSFDGATLYSDISREDFLALAYAVLVHSPHAAAISFCREYSRASAISVSDINNISGKGIECLVDGAQALFGNVKLLAEYGIDAPNGDVTAIYGAYDGKLLGRLEFSSRVKSGMKQAIDEMRSRGASQICVISGDAEVSVRSVCEQIGIEEYYSGCAPHEKLEIFEKIQEQTRARGQRKYTAYCGDGLNDSAVITVADVGIAMGGCGSALTVENADIVLMDDDPQRINTAIDISRRTARVANSNIAICLGIKIGVVGAGLLLGLLSLQMPIELAVIADVGAAVAAVLNSLRAGKGEKHG